MSKEKNSNDRRSARKRLNMDGEVKNTVPGKKKMSATGSTKRLSSQTKRSMKMDFVPNFEKPHTRSKSVGVVVGKGVSATVGRKSTTNKKTMGEKLKRTNGNSIQNKQFGNAVEVGLIMDASNNNVSIEENRHVIEKNFRGNEKETELVVNPDTSKFVLTKWGDVSILGKRKLLNADKDDIEEETQGDGIMLEVEMDEFAEEPDQLVNTSSDEEPVQLGGSASSANRVKEAVARRPDSDSEKTIAEGNKWMNELPQFQSMMSQLLDEKLKQLLPQCAIAGKGSKGEVVKNRVVDSNVNTNLKQPNLKSPSDTTIYAPALIKQSNQHPNFEQVDNIDQRISEFVGQARKEVEKDLEVSEDYDPGEGTSGARDNHARKFVRENDMLRESELDGKKARTAVIEAKKFRAAIATPPGNIEPFSGAVGMESNMVDGLEILNDNVRGLQVTSEGTGPMNVHVQNMGQPLIVQQTNTPRLSDDDFFHLTCHIEPSLIQKIENGEFVELERLLPKDRGNFSKGGAFENRFEWVQRDGGTFLVAANSKENKITGIRKWEQAFRAYATIYCAANPQRAKEIWQYIAVINTAASAYSWDNVYNYDITFRHLMAFNPSRSWAVTYNQMWNLSMRDPLPRHQNNQRNFFQFNQGNGNGRRHSTGGGGQGQQQNSRRKSSDYCWSFNKGVKCKFGNRCKFIERCSFCDLPNHGIHACPKAEAKNGNKNTER